MKGTEGVNQGSENTINDENKGQDKNKIIHQTKTNNPANNLVIKPDTNITEEDESQFQQMMGLSAFQLLVTGNTLLYEKIQSKSP